MGTIDKTDWAHKFIEISAISCTNGRKIPSNLSTFFLQNASQKALMPQLGASKQSISVSVPTFACNDSTSSTDQSDIIFVDNDSISGDSYDTDSVVSMTDSPVPDRDILLNWSKYVASHKYNGPMPKSHIDAINLMLQLRRTKAPLKSYKSLMTWHFRANNQITANQTVSDSPNYVSKKKLFKYLQKRYNYDQTKMGEIREITLPHTKAKAKLVVNNVESVLTSLLTDPRIRDEYYLFFGNNPTNPPPENLNYVGDLNTGRAYVETYRQLIPIGSNKVLLPVLFYIDGANTGHFADLPVTAVKISLGIFTRKAREKDHMWRILGFIPAVSKHKSRGKRLMLESMHVDGVMYHQNALEEEGQATDNKVCKAQDLHCMLREILSDYVKLQAKGFIWNLPYQNSVYNNIHFVLFTPFLKVDGDEAEKLCGKYTSRGQHVKMLCRYCECPTDQTDQPKAAYPYKTPAKIQKLVDKNDEEALKNLSQQNISNAMYDIRFGRHNDRGIHSACPMEMLHALLLGVFKYVRDCFFEQVGATSKLADDINGYSKQYGALFGRQSDRDLPKTAFANGIRRGKLMASEYPGILLCMAVMLRSTAATEALYRRRPSAFGQEGVLDDWTLLVETLLQWEMWLKQDQMQKNHVELSEKKHRYIMYLIKKVGKRVKGMGLRISKYHGISHMTEDILNFGVPMEYDTGSNERGHKITKTAARLTQKKEETFDQQTSQRLAELHLLEMAEQEFDGRCLWNYCKTRTDTGAKMHNVSRTNQLGGHEIIAYLDENTQQAEVARINRGPKHKASLERDCVLFLKGLQDLVEEYIGNVALRANYTRENTIFRGTSKYKGGVWRDWVMVDWGTEEGILPCKIWGFVDLGGIPTDKGLNYGLVDLEPNIYAVVESSKFEDATNMGRRKKSDRTKHSEIFTPILTDVGGLSHNRVSDLKFVLADVDAFVETIAVIPDLGGQPNRYFTVKKRREWAKDFENWLEDSDDSSISDSESSEESVGTYQECDDES